MTTYQRRSSTRWFTVLAASVALVAAVVVPTSAAAAAGPSTLSGRVTYGGALAVPPLADVTVRAWYSDPGNGQLAWIAAPVGSDGRYSVSVPAAELHVVCTGTWGGQVYDGYGVNCNGWPGTIVTDGATDRVLDLELDSTRGMVSGTVTRGGVAVTEGRIWLGFGWVALSDSGRYDSLLWPGDHQVFVDSGGVFRSGGTVTVVAGVAQTKNIDLAPLSEVQGRVMSADGQPVEAAVVQEDEGSPTYSSWSGSDGKLVLNVVDVGTTMTLGVNRQSGQSLYTGRYYAGPDRLGAAKKADAVKVTASGPTTDLGTIKLDKCGTVSGRVDNSPAGMDVWVTVFNDDDADLVTRSAPLAADGSFAVTGLLPGAYYAALNVRDTDEWVRYETFFDGVSPESGAPNVVVPASCGEVTGVDFGAPEPPGASGVVPVMPVRLADWSGVQGFGAARCVAVSQAGAPAGAQGVLVNVASVSPPTEGNALVFPSDGSASPVAPEGASVTFEPGQTVASAAFAKVGDDGKVCVYSQSGGASRVVLDVSGFSMPGSGVTLQASRRLLDTRTEASGLAARSVREVQVGGKVGVPADAKAVVVTVTTVMPSGVGHLRVFPATGTATAPDVATLHYAPGTTKSNAAIVPLGNGGKIGLYSDTGAAVQVVVDVTGYVTADSTVYRSIDPARVLDTRATAAPTVRKVATLSGGRPVAFDVAATGLVPGASAVVLNVTAIGPNSVGNLRVYPDDEGTGATAPPGASNINYIAGRNIPNLVMVKVPADGKIMLYSDQPSWGTVDVAIDLVGYVTSG